MKLFLHKLTHWEYWPFWIVYIPIYFQWIYYSISERSLFFFNAANPTIVNGGFMAESKAAIYDLIPTQYYPKTILIKEKTAFEVVLNKAEKNQIEYPFIAKPDIGLRGSGVKKINCKLDLKKYCENANFDFLLQDLIPFKNEIGVFYIKFPNEKLGKITGIVSKEFLIIEGNGKDSIENLVKKNPRYAFQLNVLRKEYKNYLKTVLPNLEKINLVPFGNHSRGAKFIDDSDKNNPKLTKVIDDICKQINGFYFGRIDLMYNNYDDLENNKNYSIVEINGSGSEPTHIYDPKHSLFFAWKELSRHISYMHKISQINHKNGVAYLSFKEGVRQYKIHWKQSNKIINF